MSTSPLWPEWEQLGIPEVEDNEPENAQPTHSIPAEEEDNGS